MFTFKKTYNRTRFLCFGRFFNPQNIIFKGTKNESILYADYLICALFYAVKTFLRSEIQKSINTLLLQSAQTKKKKKKQQKYNKLLSERIYLPILIYPVHFEQARSFLTGLFYIFDFAIYKGCIYVPTYIHSAIFIYSCLMSRLATAKQFFSRKFRNY